ncbi:DAO-domain-containing protein [Coniophora puteana RWD-64-598 SS2]|uniref:DAO-domain-containing protein n=1 Tax=Coniophora puteana (strain RWD-64-598) TaxID=741705 RepID=A0A5M3N4J9_CONPW|nr:DAO-domain-containing protein [Coniophora puteana RWD-64-598 SS2]EIW86226.1 DAO-domain-containing protein [Coniophora puteana RWD-64-598 SS2]
MGNILSFLSGPGPKREGGKPSETSNANVKAQQSPARRTRDLDPDSHSDSHPEPSAAPLTSSSLLPAANPTTSFWLVPPSPIATHVSSETVPLQADVVVIGSGITAASFARTLLDYRASSSGGASEAQGSQTMSVVMLEARETCSGATGRNGGHINPPLYHDYAALKAHLGARTAQQIVRFRLSHLDAVRRAVDDEERVHANNAGRAQFRDVEAVDVFFERATFERAKALVGVYSADMPVEGARYEVCERAEAVEKFGLSPLAVGCIATHAGAVHPYRLVTGILARLLEDYPERFTLYAHTPCTSISGPSSLSSSESAHRYTVHTPRGRISARHIVHATNAYASGLLPGFARTRAIRPLRETMSAQRAGTGSALREGALRRAGGRSFVFFDERRVGFDYLTQLPGAGWEESEDGDEDGEGEGGYVNVEKSDDSRGCDERNRGGKGERSVKRKGGELMFGAGFDGGGELDGLGNADDSAYSTRSAAHVSGALPVYFGEANWGAEALPGLSESESESESDADEDDADGQVDLKVGKGSDRKPRENLKKKKVRWHQGRVKALWSGILSTSADGLPWVGRLPPAITGRAGPQDHDQALSTAVEPVRRGDGHLENEKQPEHQEPSDPEKHCPIATVSEPGAGAGATGTGTSTSARTGGEWIAAGYSGEGMVYAWQSARALAYMVLGGAVVEEERVREWLPGVFCVSEERLRGLGAVGLGASGRRRLGVDADKGEEAGVQLQQRAGGGLRDGWMFGKSGVYAQAARTQA